MAAIYRNFLSGTLSADITNVATSMSSAGLAALPVVTAPDFMWLVLDPSGSDGAPEIVQVTSHTASATTATIVRAQQGTTGRAHLSATEWAVPPTQSDFDQLPFRILTTRGDLLVATAANTVARLGLGTNGLPLVAGATDPSYAALTATGLASNAVTTAKIADNNVTTAKILDQNVTEAKLETSVLARVGVTVRHGSVVYATGYDNFVSWVTEDQDTDGFLAVPSNTITIPAGKGGLYAIGAQGVGPAGWTNNTNYIAQITVNSATFVAAGPGDTSSLYGNISIPVVPMAAGETIRLYFNQTTGSNQTFQWKLWAYRIGR